MEKTIETIAGDMPGLTYDFPVYRFRGDDPQAPSAYLQAALHADELPGTAALHVLMKRLRTAEAEGRIAADVTVVPTANPIGRAQSHFSRIEGRFHLGTRANFNRDFPLLDRPDPALLPPSDAPATADRRLKARLLALSLGHDIVLDLHCDDEGVSYFYVPAPLWPGAADLAAALGCAAVLHWGNGSDGAFEEAAFHPHRAAPDLARRVVATVEFRGQADVFSDLAEADADGLFRFLVGRGVIRGPGAALREADRWAGLAASIDQVAMIKAPAAGLVLFHVAPGARVSAGDLLATVVTAPGEADGEIDVLAPEAGLVLTRRIQRQARCGEDLLKLVTGRVLVEGREGTLEE